MDERRPCDCEIMCSRHDAADALYEALYQLRILCGCADVNGELSAWITGESLDSAQAALDHAGRDKEVA